MTLYHTVVAYLPFMPPSLLHTNNSMFSFDFNRLPNAISFVVYITWGIHWQLYFMILVIRLCHMSFPEPTKPRTCNMESSEFWKEKQRNEMFYYCTIYQPAGSAGSVPSEHQCNTSFLNVYMYMAIPHTIESDVAQTRPNYKSTKYTCTLDNSIRLVGPLLLFPEELMGCLLLSGP